MSSSIFHLSSRLELHYFVTQLVPWHESKGIIVIFRQGHGNMLQDPSKASQPVIGKNTKTELKKKRPCGTQTQTGSHWEQLHKPSPLPSSTPSPSPHSKAYPKKLHIFSSFPFQFNQHWNLPYHG